MAVLVIGGFRNGFLEKNVLETVSAAKYLAEEISLLVYTKDEPDIVQKEVGWYDFNRVFILPLNGHYDLGWQEVLAATVKVIDDTTQAVLIPANAFGSALAPRLAYRLQVGIVTDCLGVTVKEHSSVMFHKEVFGSKAIACYAPDSKPVIVTIKTRAFDAVSKNEVMEPPSTRVLENEVEPAFTLLETKLEDVGEGKLEDAMVIVSGGRGIGGPEGFVTLQGFAGLMGASVGASRAAVDAGWISSSRQVGLTGKTVHPDLYIAVGISGASQHMAGLSKAKKIVAINSDPEAPIFEEVHIGVVADWKKVIPVVVDKLQRKKNG